MSRILSHLPGQIVERADLPLLLMDAVQKMISVVLQEAEFLRRASAIIELLNLLQGAAGGFQILRFRFEFISIRQSPFACGESLPRYTPSQDLP